jgi:hypothetical protein
MRSQPMNVSDATGSSSPTIDATSPRRMRSFVAPFRCTATDSRSSGGLTRTVTANPSLSPASRPRSRSTCRTLVDLSRVRWRTAPSPASMSNQSIGRSHAETSRHAIFRQLRIGGLTRTRRTIAREGSRLPRPAIVSPSPCDALLLAGGTESRCRMPTPRTTCYARRRENRFLETFNSSDHVSDRVQRSVLQN